MKLQRKLFISIFALSFLTICIMLYAFYQKIYSRMAEDLRAARIEVLDGIGNNIDNMSNTLLFAISVGPFQRQFKDVLTESMNKDPYEFSQFYKQVQELFSNYSDTYQYLDISYYVSLLGYNGFSYSSMAHFQFDTLTQSDWIDEVVEADGRIVWVNSCQDYYSSRMSKDVFTIARVIKGGNSLKPVGVLAIFVDEASLYRTYGSLMQERGSVFVMDRDGQIVSHSDKSKIGTVWTGPLEALTGQEGGSYLAPGGGQLITYRKLTSSEWWLVEDAQMSSLPNPAQELGSQLVLVAMACVVGSVIIAFLVSRRLTKPMVRLCQSMQEFSDGNLSLQLEDGGGEGDEMSTLVRGFNHMVVSINGLIGQIRAEEAKKKRAEVRFLQAQINPHFICNTLNAIRCMILMGRDEEAAQSLMVITRLIRKFMDGNRLFVTLDDELNNLADYMAIQRYRYDQRLDLTLDIAPNVRIALIPKLILQPVVENSIFHGIGKNLVDGEVQIRARREQDLLSITVSDNGGMSPEKLAALRRKLLQEDSDIISGDHIGLGNINCRLKRLYGERAGLAIQESTPRRTTIHIWLPYTVGDFVNLARDDAS